ncbi:MBL fold metallo-hydrolase [Taibaiella soli]|uniref:Metallo-beta-lactamase domain-containing protein n=1 Tax=Taibaiella soli TaxID=1649169 RepID=A0A2W2C1S8_9BACT|nr:hypothetical protein [Taibaiella soli]PZF74013.1 hypothetical protein DN068_05310 [Taibaiella soli]
MNIVKIATAITLATFSFHATAKEKDYLGECWNKQVKAISEKSFLSFHFTEKLNELTHNFEPWKTTHYDANGIIYTNADYFLKDDTLTNTTSKRTYYSKTQYSPATLLLLDYGDKDLYAVTKDMFTDQPVKAARYTPSLLIGNFRKNKTELSRESNKTSAVYQQTINKTIVKLYISKSTGLLDKITTLSDDDLFGDVLTTYNYSSYQQSGKQLYYPKAVYISKINGKVLDTVRIENTELVSSAPDLLKQPDNYTFKEKEEKKPAFTIEQYSDHIHFINLEHTNDRVMVVEFKDFLLVAEAPLNSKNGDIIVAEAHKIAPDKPIRYFAFSHYHPHYTGGLRPFVHEGATVLSTAGDTAYIRYLATNPHSLAPDKLYTDPKPLQFEIIDSQKTITDGEYIMRFYYLGARSHHTKDYLVYYFPSEQLLFEGDLVGIPKDGTVKKSSAPQQGLYDAIIGWRIPVKTVIQSWPVSDYGLKTQIPFSDIVAASK